MLREKYQFVRMNQVQFFYDDELITLQEKINMWLQENKEVKIIATNLSSLGKPSPRAGIVNTEKYVFYILYSTHSMAAIQELKVAEQEISTTMIKDTGAINLTN